MSVLWKAPLMTMSLSPLLLGWAMLWGGLALIAMFPAVFASCVPCIGGYIEGIVESLICCLTWYVHGVRTPQTPCTHTTHTTHHTPVGVFFSLISPTRPLVH